MMNIINTKNELKDFIKEISLQNIIVRTSLLSIIENRYRKYINK